jgi:hypothetical protein
METVRLLDVGALPWKAPSPGRLSASALSREGRGQKRKVAANQPSPPAGEGGAKRRVRGLFFHDGGLA